MARLRRRRRHEQIMFERAPQEVCGGCGRESVAVGTQLCAGCREISDRVDRKLVNVSSDDPVACDACNGAVDFDARVAVITRECGGAVLCDRCEATFAVGGAA